ncbi:MAG: MFS transporter [Bacteroidales bacterium]|nr:MFS transporter [Bacteroidales bacterium]
MANRTLRDSVFMRWLVLILTSAVMFFNYYFYDALSPLKDLMQENLGFSSSEYGTFMSAYSVPNVFLLMAVLGGIILDKIGIRITGFVFILFMAIGTTITAYGASETYLSGGFGYGFMNSFWPSVSPALKMMYLGFFLFGLGAETSIVVLSKVIVKWFKGKEIALALGLNLAIGRLGTALALNLSPTLAEVQWTNAIWFGVMLLWIGLLTFIIYIFMDIKIDRQIRETIPHDPEDEFRWRDLKLLVTNPTFIYITLLCVTFYSAVFPFVKYAPDLLMNKYDLERQISANISSILMYGTIVLTPLFGWIADYKGKSATLMYLGSVLLIVAHLMFAKTMIPPYVPIFILGVAFALVPAAMWPAVTKIVGENKIGTAYGAMFSVQNLGLWALPILIGMVLDSSNPNYQTALTNAQYASLQENGLYHGTYHRGKDEVGKNAEFKVKYIVHQDSCTGDIVWKAIHEVRSDANGNYRIHVGEGDVISNAEFEKIDVEQYNLGIRIKDLDKKPEVTVVKETLNISNPQQTYSGVYRSSGELLTNERFEALITVYHRENNDVVYSEKQNLRTDDQGKMKIEIGQGAVQEASYKYFNLRDGNYCAEVLTPLDYTNPMLMLSLLGVLGLFFAFLLKREDKTSGYGLEQPNKTQ